MQKKIIAVDFDGTLHTGNRYPYIGEPNTKLINFIKEHENDYIWVLWTCREGKQLQYAIDWLLLEHQLIFHYVNRNVPAMVKKYGDDCRKIFADLYLDDKNVDTLWSLQNRLKRL